MLGTAVDTVFGWFGKGTGSQGDDDSSSADDTSGAAAPAPAGTTIESEHRNSSSTSGDPSFGAAADSSRGEQRFTPTQRGQRRGETEHGRVPRASVKAEHGWVRHTNSGRTFYRRKGDDGSTTLSAPPDGEPVEHRREDGLKGNGSSQWFEERWRRLEARSAKRRRKDSLGPRSSATGANTQGDKQRQKISELAAHSSASADSQSSAQREAGSEDTSAEDRSSSAQKTKKTMKTKKRQKTVEGADTLAMVAAPASSGCSSMVEQHVPKASASVLGQELERSGRPKRKRLVQGQPEQTAEKKYIRAEKWEGHRTGYVYKLGRKGQGYYLDAAQNRRNAIIDCLKTSLSADPPCPAKTKADLEKELGLARDGDKSKLATDICSLIQSQELVELRSDAVSMGQTKWYALPKGKMDARKYIKAMGQKTDDLERRRQSLEFRRQNSGVSSASPNTSWAGDADHPPPPGYVYPHGRAEYTTARHVPRTSVTIGSDRSAFSPSGAVTGTKDSHHSTMGMRSSDERAELIDVVDDNSSSPHVAVAANTHSDEATASTSTSASACARKLQSALIAACGFEKQRAYTQPANINRLVEFLNSEGVPASDLLDQDDRLARSPKCEQILRRLRAVIDANKLKQQTTQGPYVFGPICAAAGKNGLFSDTVTPNAAAARRCVDDSEYVSEDETENRSDCSNADYSNMLSMIGDDDLSEEEDDQAFLEDNEACESSDHVEGGQIANEDDQVEASLAEEMEEDKLVADTEQILKDAPLTLEDLHSRLQAENSRLCSTLDLQDFRGELLGRTDLFLFEQYGKHAGKVRLISDTDSEEEDVMESDSDSDSGSESDSTVAEQYKIWDPKQLFRQIQRVLQDEPSKIGFNQHQICHGDHMNETPSLASLLSATMIAMSLPSVLCGWLNAVKVSSALLFSLYLSASFPSLPDSGGYDATCSGRRTALFATRSRRSLTNASHPHLSNHNRSWLGSLVWFVKDCSLTVARS
eukprot:COSAG02_NODE_3092_length_7386_cov_2.686428_5_plen_987_part_00